MPVVAFVSAASALAPNPTAKRWNAEMSGSDAGARRIVDVYLMITA
ncbi:hypothetical protein [Candidatus Palauibacter sp.]